MNRFRTAWQILKATLPAATGRDPSVVLQDFISKNLLAALKIPKILSPENFNPPTEGVGATRGQRSTKKFLIFFAAAIYQ